MAKKYSYVTYLVTLEFLGSTKEHKCPLLGTRNDTVPRGHCSLHIDRKCLHCGLLLNSVSAYCCQDIKPSSISLSSLLRSSAGQAALVVGEADREVWGYLLQQCIAKLNFQLVRKSGFHHAISSKKNQNLKICNIYLIAIKTRCHVYKHYCQSQITTRHIFYP